MKTGLAAPGGSRGLIDSLAVAAAVLASITLIQLVTGSAQVTLAYAGGLVVLGLIAFAAARRRTPLSASSCGMARRSSSPASRSR